MNQIYRVVFNTLTGAWQAVSEIARGHSRSAHAAQPAAWVRRPQRPLFQATAMLAATLSTCGIAQAAEQYWDASNTTNGTIDGGDGTWKTFYPNWNNADGAQNSMWNPGNTAIFQGTAGTVTLDGAQTASGLTFRTTGYLLEGSALGLTTSHPTAGAAVVTVDPNVTATLNMALTGQNSVLKKSGAGTLVLNGANTYTGGTQLEAGTLVVGNDSALGKGTLTVTGPATLHSDRSIRLANDVVLTAALTVAGSSDLTLNGVVSGAGSLVQNHTGTLTLNAANTYQGGTTLAAGVLNVSNDKALGSGSLLVSGQASLGNSTQATSLANDITLNANLIVSNSHEMTLTGTIGGSGSLHKVNAGTLVLTGSNPYSGGTILSAGTLIVGSNQALGTEKLTTAAGTTLDANQSVSLGNAIMLGGALNIGGTADMALQGVVADVGGLVKSGASTLTLSGGNTYSGGTLVNAGTLVAAHANALGSGAVTVGTGAALEVAHGTTLQVGDNLTFHTDSTYRVFADPSSGDSSKIEVAGTATLAGSVLHVGKELNAATDFQVGKTYTILQAQGIVGQFDAHTSSYAYLDTALGYTATDVTLQLQRKNSGNGNGSMRFADLAATTNQASVANSIESLGRGNPLFDHIETLPAGAPAAAFNSLSGDTHASVAGSLGALTAQAASLGQQRLHNNLTAGYRPGAAMAHSDGPLPASAWPTSKALPAWVEVVGHRQTLDGSSNAPGVKQNVYGLFLGADEEVGSSGWRVGGSLGYTNADAEVKSRDASADISSYSASVYTGKGFSHGMNRVNVMGGLAYTHHRIDSQRSVTGLGQNLKADYTANTLQLFGEVGYAMGQYSKQGIEPFAGINISQQRVGSFQESGGFAALLGQSSSDTRTSSTLGVRAHSDIKLAGKATRLKGTVGWRHAWGDVTQSTTMAFAGSSSFTVAGTPLARNTALLGLQAEVELSRRAALELGYQGEYGSGTRDHAVNVKMRWAY